MTTMESQRRNKTRTRAFTVLMTDEEYEACFQAAALADKSAAGWARDLLISAALRARWKGQVSA